MWRREANDVVDKLASEAAVRGFRPDRVQAFKASDARVEVQTKKGTHPSLPEHDPNNDKDVGRWVASQRSICTMISETHLGPTGQSRAATVLDRLGIRAHSAPAASTDKGGWAGGLLAAAHRHRNIA